MASPPVAWLEYGTTAPPPNVAPIETGGSRHHRNHGWSFLYSWWGGCPTNFVFCHTNCMACQTNFQWIFEFSYFKIVTLTQGCIMMSVFKLYRHWNGRFSRESHQPMDFCPTNFAKETPPMIGTGECAIRTSPSTCWGRTVAGMASQKPLSPVFSLTAGLLTGTAHGRTVADSRGCFSVMDHRRYRAKIPAGATAGTICEGGNAE